MYKYAYGEALGTDIYIKQVDLLLELKERPPPISDEEQRLNRRQRCTLSKLRSGHCHLVPTTTAYKWWNCQVFRPANCCPSNRFLDGFPDPSQFAAAKLTYYSSKSQRPSDSSRSWQCILLSGVVHPNPGPTTKCPGEIFMQWLFWMGTFEVFWSSKRSRV